jgi:plasmid stabilization system protein ParE
MRFNVTWAKSAEDDLASLWTDAAPEDRQGITSAANAIDQELRTDPQEVGESRPNGRRILFEAPLAVVFQVRDQARTVIVLKVWRFSGRK